MRKLLPIAIFALTQIGLMDVLSAQVLECTPTKTIILDAPSADWRLAEQRDRERYSSTTRAISGAEIAAMVERPQTVKQLLLNLKTAVDRDLLVQKGFYETPVLMKFFAASAIKWQKPHSPWASQKIATLTFDSPTFGGVHGYAKLGRSHIVEHDGTSKSEEHNVIQGEIRLHGDKSGTTIPVHSVVDIFGMPILAHRRCGDSGFGHGPSSDDSTCKGQMIYTYSKKDLPSATLAFNQAEFTVRLDATERRSTAWDLRSAEGRQRFLCDEDELRDFSILQRTF